MWSLVDIWILSASIVLPLLLTISDEAAFMTWNIIWHQLISKSQGLPKDLSRVHINAQKATHTACARCSYARLEIGILPKPKNFSSAPKPPEEELSARILTVRSWWILILIDSDLLFIYRNVKTLSQLSLSHNTSFSVHKSPGDFLLNFLFSSSPFYTVKSKPKTFWLGNGDKMTYENFKVNDLSTARTNFAANSQSLTLR